MAGQTTAYVASSHKTIGSLLRASREAKGLMIREIAATAGVDSSHLGKFERDQRIPPLDLVPELAKAYGVAPNELKRRILAKKLWAQCGDDPALLAETAAQLQEDAATYGAGSGVARKKRTLQPKS